MPHFLIEIDISAFVLVNVYFSTSWQVYTSIFLAMWIQIHMAFQLCLIINQKGSLCFEKARK